MRLGRGFNISFTLPGAYCLFPFPLCLQRSVPPKGTPGTPPPPPPRPSSSPSLGCTWSPGEPGHLQLIPPDFCRRCPERGMSGLKSCISLPRSAGFTVTPLGTHDIGQRIPNVRLTRCPATLPRPQEQPLKSQGLLSLGLISKVLIG